MGTRWPRASRRNSVGSKQIKDGKVKAVDLADGSVTSEKVADFEISNQDLAPGNTVNTDKIGDETIASRTSAPMPIGNSELGRSPVRTSSVNVANNATGKVTAPARLARSVISGGGGFAGVTGRHGARHQRGGGGGWTVEGENKSGRRRRVRAGVLPGQ